jgi:hypothetical protein
MSFPMLSARAGWIPSIEHIHRDNNAAIQRNLSPETPAALVCISATNGRLRNGEFLRLCG